MNTKHTVTVADNTIDLATLATVNGGVTRGPNGEGCTEPRRPMGPFGPKRPNPTPFPGERPFGDLLGRGALGAVAGAQVGTPMPDSNRILGR